MYNLFVIFKQINNDLSKFGQNLWKNISSCRTDNRRTALAYILTNDWSFGKSSRRQLDIIQLDIICFSLKNQVRTKQDHKTFFA